MRHSQLKAFHHVALLGGFSRAANAMRLTQPAVSEQVRNLEVHHDVLLFKRDRNPVQLTPSGEDLFRLTRQYFEMEGQISDLLSQARSAIEGELRIIADSAFHVTTILGQFRTRYPDVTLHLEIGNTAEILEHLRAYKAEIGVIGDIDPGPDMDALDLGHSDIIAFCAKGFLPKGTTRLYLSELRDHPLVFREDGSKTRAKLEQAAARKGITLVPAIYAEGREAVREVVASGAGIGIVSRAEYGRDDRLMQIELADAGLEMFESLVHLSQRRDVKVIRAFMDVARGANKA